MWLFSFSDKSTEPQRLSQVIDQWIYSGNIGNLYHQCWFSEKFTDFQGNVKVGE